jgi:hypothetical protein
MDQSNREREKGTLEQMGESMGAAAGRMFGRGTEMAANVMGSLLGSAMDTLGDWWSTADATRAAQSFDQQRDRTCRQHYESAGMSTTRDYDDVRPLYQFGYVAGQNPDYKGRDFDDVEPDLQRVWNEQRQKPHGEWPEVRGFIGFGYASQEEAKRGVPEF